VQLIFKDNGIGLPNDFDIDKSESLGLHLVKILAENQLQGELELVRKQGTEYKIGFTI
jgi:two-component sensor histidine kinase